MLLTVVTALSLAGTPSTPQTWFGASEGAGVPEGPPSASAPEVTRLTLSGAPGLPLLPADIGIFQEKTASDTLTVDLQDAALGSSSRTWTWSGSAEGWAEAGLSGAVNIGYSGLQGNPFGSQSIALTGGAGGLSETDESVLALAWTDLGVPSGFNVVQAECNSVDTRVTSVLNLTTHGVRVRLRGGGSGITSGLFDYTLPTSAGGWTTTEGDGPKSVDAAYRSSTSAITANLIYDVTRPIVGGTAQVYVDNLTLTGFWEANASTPAAAEAVTELKPYGTGGGPIWDFSGREVSNEVFLNTVDTLSVAILESPVDEQEVNTYDTLGVSLTETQQSLLMSARTDTLSVTLASESRLVVASGGTPADKPGSDSVSVSLLETASVIVAIDTTDDLDVSITEDDPSTLDTSELTEKTATDTLSVSLVDAYTIEFFTGFVALNVADELFVRVDDLATATSTGRVKSIDLIPRPKKTEIWPTNDN